MARDSRVQILRDPRRMQAERLGRFQIDNGVFHQNAASRRQPFTRQQAAQHQFRRLGPQTTVHAHRLDRHMFGKVAMQAEMPQHVTRITTRRIRQQNLAPRKFVQQARQSAFGANHRLQIIEAMRLPQKIVRPHLMMIYHTEQRRTVTLPVRDTFGIHRIGIVLQAAFAQYLRDVGIHVQVDRRKNRVRRIVQGVVEIEQPDRFVARLVHRVSQKIKSGICMRRLAAFIAATTVTGLFSLYTAFAVADDVAASAKQVATHKTVIPQRGTLYRVDHHGRSSYLFGTIHVGQAAFYPLEPQVMRALHAADRLVLELDIRNTAALQQALAKHGLYADEETIATHISADRLASLKAGLQNAGIPYDNVARMKPWMIANLLMVQTMERNGYPADEGLERYLLTIAEKEGKTVQELESADYQFGLFDHLDDNQQQDYLAETLHDLADGSELAQSVALLDAWGHADSTKMLALKQEMLTDESVVSRCIEEILLNQRNPGMTDKIEALLSSDKKIFVAIGALHLLGTSSVPDLLKQRGYRVTKIY